MYYSWLNITVFTTTHFNIIFQSELTQSLLEIHSFLDPQTFQDPLVVENGSDSEILLKKINKGNCFPRWPADRMCWIGVKILNHIFSLCNSNLKEIEALPSRIQMVIRETLSHFNDKKSVMNQLEQSHSIMKKWIPIFEDPLHPGNFKIFLAHIILF